MSAAGQPAAPPLCRAPTSCKEWALFCRVLGDGRVIHLVPLIYTVRVCIETPADNQGGSFTNGWCYAKERVIEAIVIAGTWDGQGDPPGPWIRNMRGIYGPGSKTNRRPDDDGDEAA